jgi:hypothetical protein
MIKTCYIPSFLHGPEQNNQASYDSLSLRFGCVGVLKAYWKTLQIYVDWNFLNLVESSNTIGT